MPKRIHVHMSEHNHTSASKKRTMPQWAQRAPLTYAQAGVDIDEAKRAVDAIKDTLHSTYTKDVVGDVGDFSALFSLESAKKMEAPVLVSSTDGVGTKIEVAKFARNYSTIGRDLVAMCANDVVTCGARPLFMLDYIALGKLHADFVKEIVSGIAKGCQDAGCALIGGETAEHPGVMAKTDWDMAGFCVGIVDRAHMLDPKNVQDGDVIVGLASNGLHANGYSLVRKVCLEGRTHYELGLPQRELHGKSIQDALLQPTPIYVSTILDLLDAFPSAIASVAHITGGGITENIPRALPDDTHAVIDVGTWKMPPIITYICHAAHITPDEALRTFNMGVGMALVVHSDQAQQVLDHLHSAGHSAFRIGHVDAGAGDVSYRHIERAIPSASAQKTSEAPNVPDASHRTRNRDVFYENAEDAQGEEGEGLAREKEHEDRIADAKERNNSADTNKAK